MLNDNPRDEWESMCERGLQRDAKLREAAPDLLAALIGAHQYLFGSTGPPDEIDPKELKTAIEAAIAKANGL